MILVKNNTRKERKINRKFGTRKIYNKIVDLNSNRPVITFNVNELNVPIRRQRYQTG